jgi:prephenate dehydrogenase
MNFNVENILVVGLGMIGSSIAVAAKSKGIKVNGIDLNENVVKKAIEENIIDAGIKSLEEIDTNDIDLIILAVPPKKTLELFETLDYLWNTSVTITDTSSVKNHINLKDVNNIVLSHPIAGSDKSGIDALDKNLFTEKKNILCNPFEANEDHLKKVENFWVNALNMRVEIMTVAEHDLIFAMTSHLPHLVSYALIDSIRTSNLSVKDNSGGGLREFLRLSGSNAEMWRDIFMLNRVDLIKALAGMQVSLNNLLELMTETKQIPDIFSHDEMLKNELKEIKSFKEDKF